MTGPRVSSTSSTTAPTGATTAGSIGATTAVASAATPVPSGVPAPSGTLTTAASQEHFVTSRRRTRRLEQIKASLKGTMLDDEHQYALGVQAAREQGRAIPLRAPEQQQPQAVQQIEQAVTHELRDQPHPLSKAHDEQAKVVNEDAERDEQQHEQDSSKTRGRRRTR